MTDVDAPDDKAIADGARLALDGVTHLGRARLGDKTLVDALVPFVEALSGEATAGRPLARAWKTAAGAAQDAAKATSVLTPRLGRARPLAERSIGHPDAGAVSLAMVAAVVSDFIGRSR